MEEKPSRSPFLFLSLSLSLSFSTQTYDPENVVLSSDNEPMQVPRYSAQ